MRKPKLSVVKGEFGNRDLGRLVAVEPVNEPIKQFAALFRPPQRVLRIPTEIHIDPSFQRHITERGKGLIHGMIREWDWSAFTPPAIYLDEASGVEVAYDGQHTLIAAASREDIETLPMDLYDSLSHAKEAAHAFTVRNTARIPVNTFQLFKSAKMAGHGWALKLVEIARKTGFRIAEYPGDTAPDVCQSISTLKNMLDTHGAGRVEQIMRILVGNAINPIREQHIKAIDMLLHSPEYTKLVRPSSLKPVLRGLNNNLVMGEVASESVKRGMTRHHCLANIYLREYQGVHGVH